MSERLTPRRLIVLISAAWLGLMLAVALLAAPSAFAVLDRPSAGRLVGRLFALEAPVSLLVALAVVLLDRWRMRLEAQPVRPSGTILLACLALFCTIAGHYAIQPLMEEARAGVGPWSFGALHAWSMAFFGLKMGAVVALAWRAT